MSIAFVRRILPGRRVKKVRLAAVAAAVMLVGATGQALAQASAIEGSWRGTGYVTFASGDKERVSCRATYSRLSGNAYELNATCAAPGGSVSQNATLQHVGGNRYRGEIFNVQYNSYGSIVVTVSGNSQQVTVRGDAGSGSFSLRRR